MIIPVDCVYIWLCVYLAVFHCFRHREIIQELKKKILQKRKKSRLSDSAVKILRTWWDKNTAYPYPTVRSLCNNASTQRCTLNHVRSSVVEHRTFQSMNLEAVFAGGGERGLRKTNWTHYGSSEQLVHKQKETLETSRDLMKLGERGIQYSCKMARNGSIK